MQPIALLFFALFGATIVGTYIGIRRNMAPVSILAGAGVLLSIVMMTLFSLAQGNIFGQALIVGILIGGAFSIATLVIAMYFQGQEMNSEG
jgi:hypothetical protein